MTLLEAAHPTFFAPTVAEGSWWDAGPVGRRAEAVPIRRRGPALRKGREPGVYGLDLTAGCGASCPTCHVKRPRDGRVRFDPRTAEAVEAELAALGAPPRLVVLSPASDPLPMLREVRAETIRVVRVLLERGVRVRIMTRGRLPRRLVELLAAFPDLSEVALGLSTLDRDVARALEPGCGSPRGRVRDLARLVRAGVDVEVRLEPLVPDLTDTRENLAPLFRAVAAAGASRVVAHYLYLHPSMQSRTVEALAPFGLSERLEDLYEGGPAFPVGSLGPFRHLPLPRRLEGLARLISWGAEFGLSVATGAAQNPDLPRLSPSPTSPRPVVPSPPRTRKHPRPGRRPRASVIGVNAKPTDPVGSPMMAEA